MNIKTYLESNKKELLIDSIFVFLVFSVPIILKVLFNFSSFQIKTVAIICLACWVIFKVIFTKSPLFRITKFDIWLLGLILYSLCHFYFFSEATFRYYKAWTYISYVFVFYMFRWCLSIKNNSNFFLNFTLLTIVAISMIEALIAYLQYFKVIEVNRHSFNFIGSFFTSPNFLAGFLSCSFNILIWYLFIQKTNKKYLIALNILSLVILSILIILSNSRGTWIAITGGLIMLLLNSDYFKQLIKKISTAKIVFGSILILLLVLFSVKYFYQLKPDSVNGRAFVAKISLKEIKKYPLKGTGLFSFHGKYNDAKANYFKEKNRDWKETKLATYVFTPYNDYLLIAFELGVLVLFLFLTLIWFVIIKTKITNETRLGLLLFTNLCIWALFNTPSNNILIMAVGIFAFALIINYGEFKKVNTFMVTSNLTKLSFVLFSILGLYVATTNIINKKKFKGFGEINNEEEAKAFIHLSKFAEDNLFSDSYLGNKLYQNGFQELGFFYMEKAYKKSSAPRIGKLLAHYYIKKGNYKRAKEIYKFNINVEPYRYEARIDLLTLFRKSNRYNELVKLSQEIIDFPVKIPSKKIDNYKKSATKNINIFSDVIMDSSKLKGSLSYSKSIKSKLLNKTLSYKIYLPPINKINDKLPVIYINDGYSYITKVEFPKVLDSLIINNIIAPVSAVFIEPRDRKNSNKNIRQELFLCNPTFVDFFTEEFIPEIEKKYPISNNKNDRTILGVSFGGLAALYFGDQAPDTFKNIAMQSPAFHPCPDIYKSYQSKPKQDFKMYLSYGTGKDTEKQDVPMIKILNEKGYDLKVDKIEGGHHKWSVWKPQLDDILIYFFGLDKEAN